MAHITGKTFTLAHLENAAGAVATPHTANVGGTQFVYASYNGGTGGGNIRVFSAAADGALTFLEDIPATAENGLSGAWEMETFTIGDTTFVAAVGQRADSLTIFSASDTAPFLEHVDTVFDSYDTRYELDNARYLSVHQVGGNTFLAATSVPWWGGPESHDDGITVFRVADDGTLTFASAFDAMAGVSSSSGWPSDTFEVDGNYYFAVGHADEKGFAIMRIDPETGELEAAAPYVGSDQPKFATKQISVQMVDGVPYLFVPTVAGLLYVYTYDGGPDAVLVTSISLPEAYPPDLSAVYTAGDSVIVAVGSNSAKGDGVLLYEFNAASGTLTEMQWLHGSRSTEPDAQPLEDVSFGPGFTIDGQPYALITSDNDATVNVYAIGGGDDVLNGTSQADLIEGFSGNDRIRGFGGDDVLAGNSGDDSLNGGTGNDDISSGDGDDQVYAGQGNDLIVGGAGADLLAGEAGNDTISGGLGNDILRGADGFDEINGGDGDDTAFGGNDNDTLRGGLGNDSLDGSGGNDFIDGEAGNDTLVGETGADTIHGGEGNDVMRGGGGNDSMHGEDGDDLIFGSAGEDMMFGGDGSDTMEGNTQSDGIFGENGNDVLRGGDGFDTLDGGAGDDVLVGGNGNDVLVGGLGVDTLRGNAQNDTFEFNSTEGSSFLASDLIDGIEGVGIAGGDIIDLSDIDANTLLGGNQAFTFLGAVSSAVGLGFGAGGLWVESSSGQTQLFGNTDDDATIELAIRINDGLGISASDYLVGDFFL